MEGSYMVRDMRFGSGGEMGGGISTSVSGVENGREMMVSGGH